VNHFNIVLRPFDHDDLDDLEEPGKRIFILGTGRFSCHQLVLWCSWLSLLSNTQAVLSSSLSGIISFALLSSIIHRSRIVWISSFAVPGNAGELLLLMPGSTEVSIPVLPNVDDRTYFVACRTQVMKMGGACELFSSMVYSFKSYLIPSILTKDSPEGGTLYC
jgi:hypothetical protein